MARSVTRHLLSEQRAGDHAGASHFEIPAELIAIKDDTLMRHEYGAILAISYRRAGARLHGLRDGPLSAELSA